MFKRTASCGRHYRHAWPGYCAVCKMFAWTVMECLMPPLSAVMVIGMLLVRYPEPQPLRAVEAASIVTAKIARAAPRSALRLRSRPRGINITTTISAAPCVDLSRKASFVVTMRKVMSVGPEPAFAVTAENWPDALKGNDALE